MVIDFIFLLMAAFGFYMGFSRGIIRTVFTVLSVLFGVVAAVKFGPPLTRFLEASFNYHNPLMFFAGLILAFMLTLILIRTLASGLEGVLQSANINIINKVAGGLVMSGLMLALFSTLVLFADRSHIINDDAKTESRLYPVLQQFPDFVAVAGKTAYPVIKDFWIYSVDTMDRLKDLNVERSESDNIFDIEEEEKTPKE